MNNHKRISNLFRTYLSLPATVKAGLILGGVFLASGTSIFAQKGYSTPWEDTYPVNGVDAVWQCLRSDGWSEEEQSVLAESAWYVMIHVDTLGQARVDDVVGIRDAGMKRKMSVKSCLGAFVPRMLDDTPLPAFYFLYNNGVSNKARQLKEGPDVFEKFGIAPRMDELKEVEYGSMGIEFFAGPYASAFTGGASTYFSPGVGGSFGVGIRFLRNYSIGAAISYTNHWLREEVPEATDASEGSSVGNFGAVLLLSRDFKWLSISVSGGLAEMGIDPELTEVSPVVAKSLNGFTTGFRIDVPVWSFDDKVVFKDGGTFRQTSGLDVMAGIRYNHFEPAKVRGWMIEAGINYRWRKRDIQSFRLRDGFYER